MRYGYFDNDKREYVIDRVDVPVSLTNYLGVKDFCAVMSHKAGGYAFYKSAEHHRITRFRANAVPLDRPGHYVYLRDDDSGEYWSVSWQPVGESLDEAKYECRHGLSYSKYLTFARGNDKDDRRSPPRRAGFRLRLTQRARQTSLRMTA
jgi:N,N'-diacetylchitobiose phosphorylase